MKRLYKTRKWKEHSQKRSQDELYKIKQKRKELGYRRAKRARSKPRGPQYSAVKISAQTNTARITVPSVFSIKHNVDQMLEFFDATHAYVKAGRNIFFDMKDIKILTADAILYMLSIFDFYVNQYGYNYKGTSGNLPDDPECKTIILRSGFLKHVRSMHRHEQIDDVLSIKSDRKVRGSIAQEVITFARDRLGKGDGRNPGLYRTLIEVMANTHHHAFKEANPYNKWWLIAHSNPEKSSVNFVFLDNGQGIPFTIKKKMREKILAKIGYANDAELILSGLNGDFSRSRTGLGYRGKGLPSIRKYAEEKNDVDNLLIISNHGFVDCNTNKVKKIDRKFYGTLLSWDFV